MKSSGIIIFLQGVLVKGVLLMSTKTWLRNINFNYSLNWDLDRVPCSQDNVIFPRSMGIVQFPEGETILRQLVLPLDGELLLPLNGKLQMSKPNDKNDKCQGKDIVFSQWKSSSWVDPNNWSGHNLATPDLEAIPCPTDSVIFPPKASFRVVMPDTLLRVAALSIAGKQIENMDWLDMMSTEEGQTQFFTTYGMAPSIKITGQKCTDKTGCECNNEQLREDVCSVMKLQCRGTPCIDPVTPLGNCCPICGAFLLFTYNEDFIKSNLEKYLKVKLSNDKIDFHVSKVHGKIQIVLFEKEGYEERAKPLADAIRNDVIKKSNLGLKLDAEFTAGSFVSPPSFRKQVFYFFGYMLLSFCTIGVLFYLYTDICKKNTQMGSHYVIFDNQEGEVEVIGSNGSSQHPNQASKQQAFDNPMYGSTAEVELHNQDISEECPIYSILEDIQLEKEGFEDEVKTEDDLIKKTK